jgi:transposase
MERVYERCAGLDVHARTVVACLRTPGPGGKREQIVRTFGTTTAELLALGDWLLEAGCTHVAMESTGVYWKPVYNILENLCEVLLVNARHIRQVPGRKTDVKDCEWIAQLLEVGLLRKSFIPPLATRQLRDITRYRKTLIQQRAAEVNRLHKLLEDANIKLGQVATDIMGVSGRAMLAALAAGERDGERLAELALGMLRNKHEQLGRALTGRFSEHHGFLLRQLLGHVEELERHIAACDAQVAEYLGPLSEAKVRRLQTIPGVGQRAAEVIVAEVGTDMSQFPTAAHLASWAGMCPGNHQSAGKRLSGRSRKGDPWLRSVLVEAALGAVRSKGTYLSARYRRVARRRGHKKAVIAVGHSILVAAWHLLAKEVKYDELGASHFDQRDTQRLTRYYLLRLKELGLEVAVQALPHAA